MIIMIKLIILQIGTKNMAGNNKGLSIKFPDIQLRSVRLISLAKCRI